MGAYLVQAAYTPESWANMVKNPHDRAAAIRPVVERLGGKVEAAYFSFGEYDIVAILQFPDNATAASFSIAAAAGGGVKAIKTTPLMTTAETIGAVQKAAGAGYQPPSA